MKGKKLLAAFLLGVGLCFVPLLGYGEVRKEFEEMKATVMDFLLLECTVRYMLDNPTSYLAIGFEYDPYGMYGEEFPGSVNTEGKVCISVGDTRGIFSRKYGTALLGQFKRSLDVIYSYISDLATDMDTDVIYLFRSRHY